MCKHFEAITLMNDFYRFVDEFNQIHEFIVTSIFAWAIMTLCASFLIVQLQLVEYIFLIFVSSHSIRSRNLIKLFALFHFVQKSNHVLDTIEMSMVMFLQLWSLLQIFIACALGEMIKNQFETFNDELNQCINWYALPIELQKLLVIVLANAQRETAIRGFGNIFCTRTTFKKVECC